MLEAKNIGVSLSGTDIVKDISVCVKDKQFVGIIGPNGCGKSTFLKSIYKVIRPREGSVYLGGKDVIKASARSVSKSMGVVGQFNDISFDFTVKEMVMLGRTPHKRLMEADHAGDYKIVEEALARVDLTAYSDRSYMTLSGGEKQRVILARAIAQEPEFLILDEPTNHLDIKYQLQILTVVKSMNIGILAALHDLSLASVYCDKLYAMKEGRMIAYGSPGEILTKELIKQIYEIDCDVSVNPLTGNLAITYLPLLDF